MKNRSDGFILIEAVFSIVFLTVLISLTRTSVHSISIQNKELKLKKEAIETAVNIIETENFCIREYNDFEIKTKETELSDRLVEFEISIIGKDSGDIYAKLFSVKEK